LNDFFQFAVMGYLLPLFSMIGALKAIDTVGKDIVLIVKQPETII